MVTEVIIHEDYQEDNLFNDIALVILAEPVNLGDNVDTVCLPPQDFSFDGNRCFSSSWGKDQWGSKGSHQSIMKKVELPIVSKEICQEKFRTTRLGHYFNLHRSFICGGAEEGENTFLDDGGSPVVCPIPLKHEQYHQAGIAAWGILPSDGVPGEL